MKTHFKNKKSLFLATAAVVVMGTGLISAPAQAFDSVNWSWDKTVTENVLKEVTVNIESNPSGMLELEKIQTQVGDVTANSSIHNISNNPPEEGDGFVQIEDYFLFVTSTDDTTDPSGIEPVAPFLGSEGQLTAELLPGGTFDEGADIMQGTVHVFGELPIVPEGAQNGLDLPEIASTATAVGNNQSITSDVSLELHDGQFLYGGYDSENSAQLTSLDTSGVSGNVNTNAAAFLTFAGALQGITPASVSASSDVGEILNASVDSAATAVGNNIDITLAAATPDDAFMLADVTQYSFANISATSTVADVTVNNYANLAALEGPLVNSAATAVGNNFAVKLTSPLSANPL